MLPSPANQGAIGDKPTVQNRNPSLATRRPSIDEINLGEEKDMFLV